MALLLTTNGRWSKGPLEAVWWATEGKLLPFVVKKAMAEVIERHESAGAKLPRSLYTDCACCSGKVGCPEMTSTDPGTSVAALWRTIFSVKLDAMHLMLHIGREMNAELPRRKKFLVDLSHAIFVQHEGDRKELMKRREKRGGKRGAKLIFE